MIEFTVHLFSPASLNIFPQNTLSSFKNYFNKEINLEGDWRVALSENIPAKIKQVNKSDLKIIFSEGLKFYEENIPFDAVPDHTEKNELSLELVPMKTLTIFSDP